MNKNIQWHELDFKKLVSVNVVEGSTNGFMVWLDYDGSYSNLVTQKNSLRFFKTIDAIYKLFHRERDFYNSVVIKININGCISHCPTCNTYFNLNEDEFCPNPSCI